VAWTAICCISFYKPLLALVRHSLNNDSASHILLIPVIVAWLLYTERAKLSKPGGLDILAALPFGLAAGLLLAFVLNHTLPQSGPSLGLQVTGLVLLFIAGFVAIFGRGSARNVWFSLAFLAFVIPFPEILLNRLIYALQYSSAAVAGWIFDVSGVPVLREGYVFRLPGLSIEVAKECSGVRSSIALVILALLIAHFAFSKFWKKAVFVLAGLIMMAVKNGVRIATLTILAKYVDPSFLFGRLHHEGGVVFFLFGLALLIPVYWLLRRGETSGLQSTGAPITS